METIVTFWIRGQTIENTSSSEYVAHGRDRIPLISLAQRPETFAVFKLIVVVTNHQL